MFPSCCDHQTYEADAVSLPAACRRICLVGRVETFARRVLLVGRAGRHDRSRDCLSGWPALACSEGSEARDLSGPASSGSDQADRAISTGRLNALPRLHLRPIDVVVFHGSQGDLVLRGASRLDAFSGYPVRS